MRIAKPDKFLRSSKGSEGATIMAHRSNKQEKRRKREQKKLAKARRKRFPSPEFLTGGRMTVPPGAEIKMSEVLLEFLEPYSEYWTNEDQFNKLLTVGLVAWNAALLSGSKRNEFIEQMAHTLPADVRQDMRSIVEEMIRRKEAHFARNRRTIFSYELTMTPSGPHLTVLSTLDTQSPSESTPSLNWFQRRASKLKALLFPGHVR
jgi:hypothetical protein